MMLYFYQHIPYSLNPVAVQFFGLSVDWYSLMYLVGFLVVFGLLKYRIKHGEFARISNQKQSSDLEAEKEKAEYQKQKTDTLFDLMLIAFGGLLLGGRLGYVLFYNLTYYMQNPLAIVSPYDPMTHQFIGIYGMSYHGALIGTLIAGWIFIKIKKLNFWQWANFIAPAIPAGYFFGRLGNFLNGELYGRATDKAWGMYFPSDLLGFLRHPSALYEAVLEGLILFLILWPLRNKEKYKKHLLAIYLIGYATMRIIAEFFREPDLQIGYLFNFLTLGQILSLVMLILGLLFILVGQKEKKVV